MRITNGRGIVDMEMGLFDTLSMVTLGVRQAEQSLLEEITVVKVRTGLELPSSGTHSSPFQNAKAIFCKPWVSETPAIPSSPHRKALDLAWSWGKSVKLDIST